VYLAVLFNQWNQVFYDSLQEKNSAVFWAQLWRFSYLAFAYIVIAVYKFYLTQLLEIRWRAWLTQHFLARWLSDQAFYVMELARFGPTRGTADRTTRTSASRKTSASSPLQTLGLGMGLLHAAVTLVSFVGILWRLSGDFAFSRGRQRVRHTRLHGLDGAAVLRRGQRADPLHRPLTGLRSTISNSGWRPTFVTT
jgi:putative ATP-binding cassette transporter